MSAAEDRERGYLAGAPRPPDDTAAQAAASAAYYADLAAAARARVEAEEDEQERLAVRVEAIWLEGQARWYRMRHGRLTRVAS